MQKRSIIFLVIFFLVNLFASIAYSETINDIIVIGTQRLEKSTVIEYLDVKIGDNITSEKKANLINKLYATGLFQNIDIQISKSNLTVTIKENPLISKIEIKGNKRVSSSRITKELLTAVGQSLNDRKIKTDIITIKNLYKKSARFNATVDCKIEELGLDTVKVIFNIIEGNKTLIRKINFIGNNCYKSFELKLVLLSKEKSWLRILDNGDVYQPEKLEYDKYLLKKFYNSLGYYNFEIQSVNVNFSKLKDYFDIYFYIYEGEKYLIQSVNVSNSIKEIDTDKLSKLISSKPGDVYNETSLKAQANKMDKYLLSIGYYYLTVHPDIQKDDNDKLVTVDFNVIERKKILVDQVNITGNLKTEDKVIRREVMLSGGDLFNQEKLEATYLNLYNLDYFRNIDVKGTPKEDNKADLNIDVVEKSTASIGFDLGWNSLSGPFGQLSIKERNFLGTGNLFSLSVHKGKKSLNFSSYLNNPYFMGHNLSAGIGVFNNYTEEFEQAYNNKSKGFRLTSGYHITDNLDHDLYYVWKNEKLSTDKEAKSIFVLEQKGKFNVSTIGHSLTYSKLDNKVIPKNGYTFTILQEYAGIGGNIKYLKHDLGAKIYTSFFQNKYTLRIRADAGHIKGIKESTVRISDRFNLGDTSLRGFEYNGVGPRDKETKESLGGQKYYTISTELLFPLGLPDEYNVTGSIFADVGALWDFDIRSKSYSKEDVYNSKEPNMSIGLGILWINRFAPIRLDYAVPILQKKYDKTQNWHFSIATYF